MKNSLLILACMLNACSMSNSNKESIKSVEIGSIEEAWSIIPNSAELAENKKNNAGFILCDSILDTSKEGDLKQFISQVYNYVNRQLIYPETEYRNSFEEEVIMGLYYDSLGYIYKVEPVWFTRNKAFLTEASRIIKSMPRFPVNKSGAISVPFVFNIQRYDSIQSKKAVK
ncbi:MAG: hypothetical protein LBK58_01890 [Prevotellaceae bacterium]|jgi:hypothetical protein|nr:hypothetical protein [Prevotellaceae bacterium]